MHPFFMRKPSKKEITDSINQLQKVQKRIQPPAGKFHLFRGVLGDQWYFHLKSRNGKVILTSEGYQRKSKAIQAIKRIQEVAPFATTVVDD